MPEIKEDQHHAYCSTRCCLRRHSVNDDWRSGPDATFIQTYSLAPGDNRESAVLLQNPVQGNYTAVLKGKNGGIGVAIVEAYVF